MNTEIFIFSHSGLFALYRELKTNHLNSRSIILIEAPFWVDQVSLNHRDHLWGQAPSDFPRSFRNLFKTLYPNHPEQQPITWGQLIHIRATVINAIKSFPNVHHYYGLPTITHQQALQRITVQISQEILHFSDQNTKIHYWARKPHEPRKPVIAEHLWRHAQPFTDLYSHIPTSQPEHICLIGAGKSAEVIMNQFANQSIIALRFPRDQLLSYLHTNCPDKDQFSALPIQEIDMQTLSGNKISLNYTCDQITFNQLSCNLYKTVGFDFLNFADLPSQIMGITPFNLNCTWVAPYYIPAGSFVHSYTLLSEQTGYFHQEFSLYPTSYCENLMAPRFKRHTELYGIHLNETYFDVLKSYIFALNTPVDDAERKNLYWQVFNDTHANTSYQYTFGLLLETGTHVEEKFPELNAKNSSLYSHRFLSDLCHTAHQDLCDETIKGIQQYLRLFYETQLAYSIQHSNYGLTIVNQISEKIVSFIRAHEDSVLSLIRGEIELQNTLYSSLKFSRKHLSTFHCIPPEYFLQEIIDVLENSNRTTDQIHLHFTFAYRIFPYMPKHLLPSQTFFELLEVLKHNSTQKSPDLRILSEESSASDRVNTFFGLIPTQLTEVDAHVHSIGRWPSANPFYLKQLDQTQNSFVSGPSGHMTQILMLLFSLHWINHQDMLTYAPAVFSYLCGSGNHNFHETYLAGSAVGLPYQTGFYLPSLPKTYLESTAYADVQEVTSSEIQAILSRYPDFRDPVCAFAEEHFELNPSC